MNDITVLMAQRIPARKKHDWSQSVMRDCDFCHQWSLTVKHEDGAKICASCCDAEYTSQLEVANAELVEALEAKQPHHNGMMQIANELAEAKRRIAALENENKRLRSLKSVNLALMEAESEYQRGKRDAEVKVVTVNLPAEYLNADGSVNADMANTCPVVSAYREAHRAAGIKVIEGEQKNG